MASSPLSPVHGCCDKRRGPGGASWSPVQSVSRSALQGTVSPQAPLLWPPVMRADPLLSWSVFRGSSDSPVGKREPPLFHLILPSQVCPLAKVRSANSACPPHRAGLVNYPSPFPRGATVSSVFRYWVSPALTLPFLTGCLTGPSNGVLCSPRVWN